MCTNLEQLYDKKMISFNAGKSIMNYTFEHYSNITFYKLCASLKNSIVNTKNNTNTVAIFDPIYCCCNKILNDFNCEDSITYRIYSPYHSAENVIGFYDFTNNYFCFNTNDYTLKDVPLYDVLSYYYPNQNININVSNDYYYNIAQDFFLKASAY